MKSLPSQEVNVHVQLQSQRHVIFMECLSWSTSSSLYCLAAEISGLQSLMPTPMRWNCSCFARRLAKTDGRQQTCQSPQTDIVGQCDDTHYHHQLRVARLDTFGVQNGFDLPAPRPWSLPTSDDPLGRKISSMISLTIPGVQEDQIHFFSFSTTSTIKSSRFLGSKSTKSATCFWPAQDQRSNPSTIPGVLDLLQGKNIMRTWCPQRRTKRKNLDQVFLQPRHRRTFYPLVPETLGIVEDLILILSRRQVRQPRNRQGFDGNPTSP